MLRVTFKPFILSVVLIDVTVLSVVLLSVVLLNVVRPLAKTVFVVGLFSPGPNVIKLFTAAIFTNFRLD